MKIAINTGRQHPSINHGVTNRCFIYNRQIALSISLKWPEPTLVYTSELPISFQGGRRRPTRARAVLELPDAPACVVDAAVGVLHALLRAACVLHVADRIVSYRTLLLPQSTGPTSHASHTKVHGADRDHSAEMCSVERMVPAWRSSY